MFWEFVIRLIDVNIITKIKIKGTEVLKLQLFVFFV